MSDDRIPLALLPRALREKYGDAVICNYRALYSRVVDGVIPAAQRNGRWSVESNDLDSIAAKLLK